MKQEQYNKLIEDNIKKYKNKIIPNLEQLVLIDIKINHLINNNITKGLSSLYKIRDHFRRLIINNIMSLGVTNLQTIPPLLTDEKYTRKTNSYRNDIITSITSFHPSIGVCLGFSEYIGGMSDTGRWFKNKLNALSDEDLLKTYEYLKQL